MPNFQEISEVIPELEKYADLMGDEYGEALHFLSELYWRSEYLGDGLQDYLGKVIKHEIGRLRELTEITTREVTEERTYTYEELVWK